METEEDTVATVRALLEKQPWMSQYLKNPALATVASKARPTDPEPRSPGVPPVLKWEPGHWSHYSWRYWSFSRMWYSYSSCHIPWSPSHHRFTTSCYSSKSYNPPSVHHYYSSSEFAYCAFWYYQTCHPQANSTQWISRPLSLMQILLAKLETNRLRGPAPHSPTRWIQQEAQLPDIGKLVMGITGKNCQLFFSITLTLKKNFHRFYPHFLSV